MKGCKKPEIERFWSIQEEKGEQSGHSRKGMGRRVCLFIYLFMREFKSVLPDIIVDVSRMKIVAAPAAKPLQSGRCVA